ncbi:MAG: hypothetical protein Q7S06_00545 [Nanoarchaeota archaeon]|nr:hypothetical protein [Nanoarchaeota archaeon]
MKIQTEQDMLEFCGTVKDNFSITICPNMPPLSTQLWYEINKEMISTGAVGKGSHLQQGIFEIDRATTGNVVLYEVPKLYPSAKVLAEYPDFVGPITGVLVNCYDPKTKSFLFHMRGKDVSTPFAFQAAAAGMGIYGQHPSVTAALELQQETGLENFRQFPGNGIALGIFPFMKAGKIPQPLFSFGFFDDLSRFHVERSLEEVIEFESEVKKDIQNQRIHGVEAHHFAIPHRYVERVVGELDELNRFYGPIYDSTTNFVRTLKDNHYLE